MKNCTNETKREVTLFDIFFYEWLEYRKAVAKRIRPKKRDILHIRKQEKLKFRQRIADIYWSYNQEIIDTEEKAFIYDKLFLTDNAGGKND